MADCSHPCKLQRLARKIEISLEASLDIILSNKRITKGTDQTARMRRLVCAFVVRKPQKTGFLGSRPICKLQKPLFLKLKSYLTRQIVANTWFKNIINPLPGRVAQSVTCLATDASLTADPGVASSILARSHTFVEIDHEIISAVILLPSAVSFKKGCCQLQAKVCAGSTG